MNQTINTAKVNKCTEVYDRRNGTLQAHALRELLQNFSALILAAFFKKNTTRKNNVVAVAIHLDNASFNFGTKISRKILNATKVNQRCRQEATKTDVKDQATLNNFDNFTGNNFASLEFILNLNPSTLVLCALLGKDEAAVLVLLLENQCLDLVTQVYNLRRICVLTDGKLASRNNALALESDVNENFIVLNLNNGTVDKIALVEVGQGAIDHLVHFFIRNVLKINNGGVLDFGQNGPLSKCNQGPFVRVCGFKH